MNNQNNFSPDPNFEQNTSAFPVPDETEIEYLLRRTQPKPGGKFYKCMDSMPWNREVSVSFWKRNQLRGFLAVLGMIIILVFVLTSPSMKAVANRIAQFFIPATSDQVTIEIPLLDPSEVDTRILWDITEASNQVGFDVKSPSPVPIGYTFKWAELKPDREAIVLNYESDSGCILQISQRRNGVEYQSVSIQAHIETVTIGTQNGEYVVGGWKATQNETPSIQQTITLTAIWDPDANVHFLRWQENDILYEIIFVGDNPESKDYLNKDALIAIAGHLR